MPRRVEDILPNNHRSIRSVPVEHPGEPGSRPSGQSADRSADSPAEPKAAPKRNPRAIDEIKMRVAEDRPVSRIAPKLAEKRISVTPPRTPHKKSRGRRTALILIIVGIIVVIGGAGYIASAFFSKATFTLIPKTVPVTVNGTYIATSASSATAAGNIVYELITVKGTASTTVPATDGAAVTSKAQGKVTVYNGYSADPQKLIAGTRLSDDSGRVYRLNSTIVIPGYSKPGASILPGSIVATMVADQPGPSYNISRSDAVSDFKIVAYKGMPKYDAMYARLASDVSGGNQGTQKVVSPTLLASTSDTLKATLTASLREQVSRVVPSGYVLYDKAFIPSFSAAETGPTEQGSQAAVTLSGTGYGVIFKRSDLISTVVGTKNIAQFGDFSYTSPGLETLDFSITNSKDFSPEKKNNLILHLAGDMKLVGTIPVDDLKQRLAGAPLGSTQEILKRYTEVIESGSGELVPPWTTVPKDISRISVVIKDK